MLSIVRQFRSPCARAAPRTLATLPHNHGTITTTNIHRCLDRTVCACATCATLRRTPRRSYTHAVVNKHGAAAAAATTFNTAAGRRAFATHGSGANSENESSTLQSNVAGSDGVTTSQKLKDNTAAAGVAVGTGSEVNDEMGGEEESTDKESKARLTWLARARQTRDVTGLTLDDLQGDYDSDADDGSGSDDECSDEESDSDQEDDGKHAGEDLPVGDWSVSADNDQDGGVERVINIDDGGFNDSDSDAEEGKRAESLGRQSIAAGDAEHIREGFRREGGEGNTGITKQGKKDPSEMRLSRRIARSGLASRREAERLIEAGEVTVNGDRVMTPALNVGPGDVVKVKRQVLPKQENHAPRLYMVHKLRGELVTRHDPAGRPTVFSRLGKLGLPDTLMPVGRLDYNTEGLLLLTNDGDLARKLELPSSNLARTYTVRVYGNITEEKLLGMRNGITIDGVRYKGMSVRVEGGGGKGRDGRNAWLTIECMEGKNRQIRKVCKYLCLTVNRLARVKFGPFTLGKVRAGGVSRLELKESFLKRLDAGTAGGPESNLLKNGRGIVLKPGATPGPGGRVRRGVAAPASRGDAPARPRSGVGLRNRVGRSGASRGSNSNRSIGGKKVGRKKKSRAG